MDSQLNVSNTSIASAGAALGYLEQMETLSTDLKDYCQTLPAIHRPELTVLISRLDSLAILLDDEESMPEIAQSLKLSGKISSKIDRLGLGAQIIRLREINKLTITEIAERLDLGPTTVSRFLRIYDKLKPSEQEARYKRTSVFDTATQLEDLNAMIYRQLAKFENSESDVHVRYVAELRQLIKAAHDWMDKVSTANKYEEMMSVVQDVLIRFVPEELRGEAIKTLQSVGARRALPTTINQ